MDERDEPVRRHFISLGNRCPACQLPVNPLLHILNPFLCPATPPLGGWIEPHKDDL